MNPTTQCFTAILALCDRHDPSLGIAFRLALELADLVGSAPSTDAGFDQQDSTVDAPDPQGDQYHASRAEPSPGRMEDVSGALTDDAWEMPRRIAGASPRPSTIDLLGFAGMSAAQQAAAVITTRQQEGDGTLVLVDLADIPHRATPVEEEELEAASGVNPYMAGIPPVQEVPDPTPPEPPPPTDVSLPGREALRGRCVLLRREGLTHKQIAHQTGVPKGTLAAWLQGCEEVRVADSKEEACQIVQILDAEVRKPDMTLDEIRALCLGVPKMIVQLATREYRADRAVLTHLWQCASPELYQQGKAKLLASLKGAEGGVW